MKQFKKHKIRNVDINTCCCEQKIAYNYLFSHYKHDKQNTLDFIQKDLCRRDDMKKYDIDLIYHIILYNFDRFQNDFFIATNYETIGKKLEIAY